MTVSPHSASDAVKHPGRSPASAQLPRRYLGAAGVQYGRYVERVLYSPALPAQRTAALILSRVTLGAWEEAAPPEARR